MENITFSSQCHQLSGVLIEGTPRPNPPEAGSVHKGSFTAPSAPCAVILLPGAFEDSHNWYAYAERLAHQGFPTLVLDFTGHGGSQGQPGLVDLRQWAYNIRDAMNALEKRGYRRFALVGIDSGGSAALLAAAHDRRLECVTVLAAPVLMLPNVGERAAFLLATAASRIWKTIKKKPLTLSRVGDFEKQRFAVDDQTDAYYKANPRWREIIRAVPIPESLDSVWIDITRAVTKIKAPVLIIHGQRDEIVPVKQSEKLNKLLSGTKKICVIEDSGHLLHLDQKKEEVYLLIARWLKHYLRD